MNQLGLELLNASQVTAEDYRRRKKRIRLVSAVRHAAKSPWVMNRLLNHSLQAFRDRTDEVNFMLPPVWLQQCLGQKLVMRIPVQAISFHMADWLQVKEDRLHTSDYFLSCGDLSSARYEIARLPVLKEVQELMASGWQFKRTTSYAKLLQAIDQGRSITRQQMKLDTEGKIQAYFQRFLELHRSVEQYGVLSNQEVIHQLGLQADREIGIALDRDGTVIKLHGGKHRFALAVAHQLRKIPVELRMVHAQLLSDTCKKHGCTPVQAIELLVQRLQQI